MSTQRKSNQDEQETMEYYEALRKNTWKAERNLADTILNYVQQHNLNYKLDKLTRGQGNCFPLSVLFRRRGTTSYERSQGNERVSSDG